MKIDDLSIGQQIVLTGPVAQHECPPWPHCHPPRDRVLNLCGSVMRVDAVCLPYISVSIAGQMAFALDTRKYKFVKANRQYVNAFNRAAYDESPMPCQTHAPKAESCCPGCGGKLVQRRVGESKWAYRCRECDV